MKIPILTRKSDSPAQRLASFQKQWLELAQKYHPKGTPITKTPQPPNQPRGERPENAG
jgi:hypothetical protein